MADATTYVQPLSGAEVISDLLAQIEEKLRVDCNLREIDGYSSGYKAKVTIHIECFGLDTATVDQEVIVDETTPDPDNPLQEPDVNLDTELVVEQEADLSAVRERSGQQEPSFEAKPVVEITPDGPVAVEPQKRKYTRRLKALAQAQGGATGPLDE